MTTNEGHRPPTLLEVSEVVCTPMAVIDEEGAVFGWTEPARRLVGYSPVQAMRRPAASMLASAADWTTASARVQRSPGPDVWSGPVALRHMDGHTLEVGLRLSRLSGPDGAVRWLVTVTRADAVLSSAARGLRPSSLLGGAPVAICIRDAELRCTWVSGTAELVDGIPSATRLGRRLSDIRPSTESDALETAMRHVLRSGTSAIDLEYPEWLSSVGAYGPFEASYFRLDGPDGSPPALCAMWVSIADRDRARERLAIVDGAAARVGTTLDVARTGQELADIAVPLLADFAIVDLADPVRLGQDALLYPAPADSPIPPFRRAGLASVNQGAPEAIWAPGEEISVPPTSTYAFVLSSGRPSRTVLRLPPDSRPHRGMAWAEKIRKYGIHAFMVVPIHARGEALGVAAFARSRNPTPFEDGDLLLAEELVARAAVGLRNANRYTRERAIALALQRNLLPHHLTGGSAVDVASRYLPADIDAGVGGDWFDVIPLSGARVALVVGDVVGHGIEAAATMGRLRTAVRALADLDLPPDDLLTHLDDLIIRLTREDGVQELATQVLWATCLYVIYDPVTRRCTMARAGHPPPAIIEPQGRITFPDLPPGTPLGVGLSSFEAVELEVPEGSVLALYTDGLVESRTQDLDAGTDRLRAVLAQHDLPLDDRCSAVVEALSAHPPADDITLLMARTHGLGSCQVASWDLPPDPAAVSKARFLSARQLARWGLEHLVTSTELIVSELVTNAVRHGKGPIGLRLIRDAFVTCEVSDRSNTLPRLRHARVTDENGRGLLLVNRLSQRRGTRYTMGEGKIVWAEQELTPGI
ncbi:SpoIIE family protein phosphatase [Streptomyces sp. MI02-7b]|uniref:ATP-binding SpoIIE family protein phosphatase n=1 Tax=Streptomyces sp. MI02-7b TaxID=462941 RepID=UPI0029B12226|nr:SpoIIE family protein phosphatase [Streptomyces sp. MI02-7b]MDX3074935.1 SpoIIE family protein phosphatase [Streptomyces sp. MI02-7b]